MAARPAPLPVDWLQRPCVSGGNISLTRMAPKISTNPTISLSPTCSPYRSTPNSTPNTDSRRRNSDACAGGTCASATFWMTRATHDAKMTR